MDSGKGGWAESFLEAGEIGGRGRKMEEEKDDPDFAWIPYKEFLIPYK